MSSLTAIRLQLNLHGRAKSLDHLQALVAATGRTRRRTKTMTNQAHLQITGPWRALLWPVYPPCKSYSPILEAVLCELHHKCGC
jgi:hypothetical protein